MPYSDGVAEEMLCRKAVIETSDRIDGDGRGGVTGMWDNRFFRWRETEQRKPENNDDDDDDAMIITILEATTI